MKNCSNFKVKISKKKHPVIDPDYLTLDLDYFLPNHEHLKPKRCHYLKAEMEKVEESNRSGPKFSNLPQHKNLRINNRTMVISKVSEESLDLLTNLPTTVYLSSDTENQKH